MNGEGSSSANPSGVQGVFPNGWHLPSDAEWKELELFLSMSQEEVDDVTYRGTNEGGMLKETGYVHWNSPNVGATNETGFTALPGGIRGDNGNSGNLRDSGRWWSSTEGDEEGACNRGLDYTGAFITRWPTSNKGSGHSVRCVQDE